MLKLAKADASLGVFFVAEGNGAEVRASFYSRTGGNILSFKVPELPAGSYRIEVRSNPPGKEIRIAAYAYPFVVSFCASASFPRLFFFMNLDSPAVLPAIS